MFNCDHERLRNYVFPRFPNDIRTRKYCPTCFPHPHMIGPQALTLPPRYFPPLVIKLTVFVTILRRRVCQGNAGMYVAGNRTSNMDPSDV